MPISVVTIEREYGSGGAFIAEQLAQRLGWTLWDKALTGEMNKLADSPLPQAMGDRTERHDPLLYRLGKVFARGSYERSLPLKGVEGTDVERIVDLMAAVVERAAAPGRSVIVGRGGAYFLRNHPTAFHVFIYAPHEEKLRRVLEMGKSREEATELLGCIDRERAAFVKQYAGNDWPTRYLYNLWINSVVGDNAVVETIVNMIALLDRQGVGPRPSR